MDTTEQLKAKNKILTDALKEIKRALYQQPNEDMELKPREVYELYTLAKEALKSAK